MWRTGVLCENLFRFLLDIRYPTQYHAGNYRIRIKINVKL